MDQAVTDYWRSSVQAQIENDGALLRLWHRNERLYARQGSRAIVLSGRRAELARMLLDRLVPKYAGRETDGMRREFLLKELKDEAWSELKTIRDIVTTHGERLA